MLRSLRAAPSLDRSPANYSAIQAREREVQGQCFWPSRSETVTKDVTLARFVRCFSDQRRPKKLDKSPTVGFDLASTRFVHLAVNAGGSNTQ
jgi:hypothetical protein